MDLLFVNLRNFLKAPLGIDQIDLRSFAYHYCLVEFLFLQKEFLLSFVRLGGRWNFTRVTDFRR